MTGTVTMRAALWNANYPQWVRGQLSARVQIARALTQLAAVGVGAAILDANPASYRWLYPSVAVVGALAIYFLRFLHVRGERRALLPNETPDEARLTERVNVRAAFSPMRLMSGASRVLRADDRFRHYCIAQMFAGFANLTIRSVVVVVIAQELLHDMPAAFWMSAVLLDVLPKLVMMGTMGRFAVYYDRVGVLRFRVLHAVYWMVSLILGMLGTWVVMGYWTVVGRGANVRGGVVHDLRVDSRGVL